LADADIADYLSYGVLGTAEGSGDKCLKFEIERREISLTSFDYANNRLVFKAPLPTYQCVIYEAGLIAVQSAQINRSRIISTFDSESEVWTNSVWDTTAVRIGPDGLLHTPIAGGNTTSALSETAFDLSDVNNADTFVLVYNVGNGNVSSIQIMFMVDSSNYYTFTIATPTAGYKSSTFTKGSATATGTPNWANINSLAVKTTSVGGGAANVLYDGLRVIDVSPDTDELLVARKVLSTPYTKIDGRMEDMEFTLPVTI